MTSKKSYIYCWSCSVIDQTMKYLKANMKAKYFQRKCLKLVMTSLEQNDE